MAPGISLWVICAYKISIVTHVSYINHSLFDNLLLDDEEDIFINITFCFIQLDL